MFDIGRSSAVARRSRFYSCSPRLAHLLPGSSVNMIGIMLLYVGRYVVICVSILTYNNAGLDMLRPSGSCILSSSIFQHRVVRITVRNSYLMHNTYRSSLWFVNSLQSPVRDESGHLLPHLWS